MSSASTPIHQPVMVDEVLELFAPALDATDPILVDATLGLAGHAIALLQAHPTLRLIGIDQDRQAIDIAQERLKAFADRVQLHHARFDSLAVILEASGLPKTNCVNGVFFDLGISSLQIDSGARGFAYSQDVYLDMRMDQSKGQTAAELLANAERSELIDWLYRYGEEKFASRIADFIIKARTDEPIERSGQLTKLIKEAIPAPARRMGGNPAKRTFQALRVAVNDELSVLQRALPQAIDSLVVGGRCLVLSFHSLEDKIVKTEFARHCGRDELPDLPVPVSTETPRLRVLTRGARKASNAEIATNPRSASVRLRAVECMAAA